MQTQFFTDHRFLLKVIKVYYPVGTLILKRHQIDIKHFTAIWHPYTDTLSTTKIMARKLQNCAAGINTSFDETGCDQLPGPRQSRNTADVCSVKNPNLNRTRLQRVMAPSWPPEPKRSRSGSPCYFAKDRRLVHSSNTK